MAQQLGILVALPNELGSIFSTHTTPHNCLRGIQQPLLAFEGTEYKYTDIYAGETTGVYRLNNKTINLEILFIFYTACVCTMPVQCSWRQRGW